MTCTLCTNAFVLSFSYHLKLSLWTKYIVQFGFFCHVWIHFTWKQNFQSRCNHNNRTVFFFLFCFGQNLNLNWYVFNQNVMPFSLKLCAKRKCCVYLDRHVNQIKSNGKTVRQYMACCCPCTMFFFLWVFFSQYTLWSDYIPFTKIAPWCFHYSPLNSKQ